MHTFQPARALGAFVLVFSGWIAGCATAPQPYAWSPPAVGKTWKVAQQNTGSYGKDVQFGVTRAEGTWNGVPAIAIAQSTGTTLLMSDQGRWHAVLGSDGKPLLTWDPPIGFDFPMQVGQAYTRHHVMKAPMKGTVFELDFACNVAAYENVAVAAGNFDAYRVICSSGHGQEIYWMSPQVGLVVKTSFRRDPTNVFGPGTQESQLLELPH